jgi:hypothetical protein
LSSSAGASGRRHALVPTVVRKSFRQVPVPSAESGHFKNSPLRWTTLVAISSVAIMYFEARSGCTLSRSAWLANPSGCPSVGSWSVVGPVNPNTACAVFLNWAPVSRQVRAFGRSVVPQGVLTGFVPPPPLPPFPVGGGSAVGSLPGPCGRSGIVPVQPITSTRARAPDRLIVNYLRTAWGHPSPLNCEEGPRVVNASGAEGAFPATV